MRATSSRMKTRMRGVGAAGYLAREIGGPPDQQSCGSMIRVTDTCVNDLAFAKTENGAAIKAAS